MRRKTLSLKQTDMATLAGIALESLSRFEQGRNAKFGTRKLLAVLAVLAVLNAELDVVSTNLGYPGNLDSLRIERALAGE